MALLLYEAAYRFETQFRLQIEQNGKQMLDLLSSGSSTGRRLNLFSPQRSRGSLVFLRYNRSQRAHCKRSNQSEKTFVFSKSG
jgi:hypothetical protein